jgi:hypothetical protein
MFDDSEYFFHFISSALIMSAGEYLRSFRGPTLWALSLPELSHLLRVSVWTLRMRAASRIEIYFDPVELILVMVYKLYND